MAAGGDTESPSGGQSEGGTSRLWTTSATIIGGEQGDTLCIGEVQYSSPPSCRGPRLEGLDWASIPHEEMSGRRYSTGPVTVVGTYSPAPVVVPTVGSWAFLPPSGTFTLTRPPRAAGAEAKPGGFPVDDFTTPCPAPEGGWAILHPDQVTAADQEALFAAARKLPGYQRLWLDQQPGNPTILNVAVTASTREASERALRPLWGGPLCVTTLPHSEAELKRIDKEVTAEPDGIIRVGLGLRTVEVYAVADDGRLQEDMDRRYGPGTVRVTSALQPYTPGGS